MGRKRIRVNVNGGLSVISAFPCGKGASVALDIPLITHLQPSGNPGEFQYLVSSIHEKLGGSMAFSLSIDSSIPERRGLKSSSALAGSILLAYAKYNDIEINDSELLKIGSEISQDTGLSATGATDDLAASILGGLCITDNIQKKLVNRIDVETVPVIILPGTPGEKSSSFGKADFNWIRLAYESMHSMLDMGNMELIAVANGYYMGQMTGNYLPESLMGGLSHDICGVNGRGPSIFLFYRESDRIMEDMHELTRRNLAPILTRLSNRRAEIVELNA